MTDVTCLRVVMRYGKKLAMLSSVYDKNDASCPFIAHTALKQEMANVMKTLRGLQGCEFDPSVMDAFDSIFMESYVDIQRHTTSWFHKIELEVIAIQDIGKQLGFFGADVTRNLLLHIHEVRNVI